MRPAGAQFFHSDGQIDKQDGNNSCYLQICERL